MNTILHSFSRGRSNRLLTDHVIDATKEFLNGTEKTFWHFGNTSAIATDSGDFLVQLFENPILRLSCDKSGVIKTVHIYAGNYYDKYGNPTDLTRERLNGLLCYLGLEGIIPQDVRVWYDRINGLCYVIRYEEKMVLNRDYCTMVSIKAIPDRLVFDDAETVVMP